MLISRQSDMRLTSTVEYIDMQPFKSSTKQFQFYSKSDYLADITHRISSAQAGDTVRLMSMGLDPNDPPIGALMNSLCVAASRGASVAILVDAYIFILNTYGSTVTPGPLFWRRKDSLARLLAGHPVYEALEKLRISGGSYGITNQSNLPFSNPFSGRSHIKTTIINDRVYLGGCNLDQADEIDLMVGWDDPKTAEWLRGLYDGVAHLQDTRTSLNGKDIEQPIDKQTTVLLDAGKPGQSIIYENALDLINTATDFIFITSQHFPNSRTAAALRQANKRGVKVTIIYNSPSKNPIPLNILHHVVVQSEKIRSPKVMFAYQLPARINFLHAKVLASESVAMVGSHNYLAAGVNFGTAEIAMHRRDPEFSRQLIVAIKDQII